MHSESAPWHSLCSPLPALARDSQGVLFYLDGVPQSLPDGAGTIAQVQPGQLPRVLQVENFSELMPLTPLRAVSRA